MNQKAEEDFLYREEQNKLKSIEKRMREVLQPFAVYFEIFFPKVDTNYYSNYLNSVKVEMFIERIYQRLENEFYHSRRQLLRDVRLIKENACDFNDPTSSICVRVKLLEKLLISLIECNDDKMYNAIEEINTDMLENDKGTPMNKRHLNNPRKSFESNIEKNYITEKTIDVDLNQYRSQRLRQKHINDREKTFKIYEKDVDEESEEIIMPNRRSRETLKSDLFNTVIIVNDSVERKGLRNHNKYNENMNQNTITLTIDDSATKHAVKTRTSASQDNYYIYEDQQQKSQRLKEKKEIEIKIREKRHSYNLYSDDDGENQLVLSNGVDPNEIDIIECPFYSKKDGMNKTVEFILKTDQESLVNTGDKLFDPKQKRWVSVNQNNNFDSTKVEKLDDSIEITNHVNTRANTQPSFNKRQNIGMQDRSIHRTRHSTSNSKIYFFNKN